MFRQFSATTLRWMPVPVPFIPRGPDDYVDRSKYGLETANPVGPDGTYLPGTYPTLDGVNVFKANDIVIALLQEKAHCCTLRKCNTAIRAAGVIKRRSSSARRRSGLHQHGSERSACAVTERDQKACSGSLTGARRVSSRWLLTVLTGVSLVSVPGRADVTVRAQRHRRTASAYSN